MPPPPPPPEEDNRLVRVRVLGANDDVARVQEIFADGMRSLGPGVVRSGLKSWRVWLLAVVVAGAAAAWTAYAYDDGPVPRGKRPPPPFAFALARSAILAFLSFLAVYACYLSTIMDTYVKESLQDDMADPRAFYLGGGGGDGDRRNNSHSCFWVAELIEGPPTTPSRLQQQQQQQQQEEQDQNSKDNCRPTLRRRLLGLAGALAENEKRVKEEQLAEAQAMLAPRSPATNSAIVGCVALHHKPGEDRAELRRMSVAEEARGRGVAVALGEALERHAKARGLKSVFCTTSSLQAPARALYGGKLGWTEVEAPGHRKHKQAEANGITFHRYEKRF